MKRLATRKIPIVGVLLLMPLMALASRISGVAYTKRGTGVPECLSGVTYAGVEGGKHVFYAVADNGDPMGLYKVSVPGFTSGGGIAGSVVVGSCITLEGAKDIEGVAYDPASGNVWVADEGRQTITEYDLAGKAHRKAPVPAMMGLDKINGNYGFESLTISGDGLTMWTANEEALKIDGERSDYYRGTTVRLVKFSRATVHDDWQLSGMYAYTTDRWSQPNNLGGSSRRGVSDLCALPDGSLLVLERELSSPTSDKEDSEARYAIYNVTARNLAAATDIRPYDKGLKGRTDWNAVEKGGWLLGQMTKEGHWYDPEWVICEGICLGPRVSDDTTILFGVSDAGDGYSRRVWMGMPLLDLNIQTLEFTSPSIDRSSISGKNYRFLDGADVSVELTDPVSTSYPIDGELKIIAASWTLESQGESGEGRSASFTVASSGAFAWKTTHAKVKSGYHVADSFEDCRQGSTASEIGGWTGEGALVEAQAYDPPVPPGFVMTNEAHTQVLNAAGDEAVRSLSSIRGTDRMDVMVRACRPAAALGSVSSDALVRIAMDEQGRLCLWHLYEQGGAWKKGWTPLSEKIYAEGEWIRIEADFDYTSSPSQDVFVSVRVNGSYQPTARGVRSPTDVRAYGPWHCIVRGGGTLPREIVFARTEVDDLMVRTQEVAAEHTGPTEVDGIPFEWFDGYGMSRDPNAPAPFLPGSTLGDVFTAGLDPYSSHPFEVTGFWLGEDGRPHVEFNGYKGESPTGYQVFRSDTPDFGDAESVGAEGTFDGNASTWSTTWEGKPESQGGAVFYKVKAMR